MGELFWLPYISLLHNVVQLYLQFSSGKIHAFKCGPLYFLKYSQDCVSIIYVTYKV